MQAAQPESTPKSKKVTSISVLGFSPERGNQSLLLKTFSTKHKGGSLNFDLNCSQSSSICKSLFRKSKNTFGDLTVLDPACIFQATDKEIRTEILNVLGRYKSIILNRVSEAFI